MKDLFEELCKGCNAKALYDEEYCDACNLKDDIAEHDKQIRADAIKEYKQSDEYIKECVQRYIKGRADAINAIKNDLHKRLTEEMNKPYQDQGLCQGLYFGIQRCDWYLDDSKEQSNTCTATVDGVKREFM